MSEQTAVDQFEALLDYLRDHRGADFTGYKRPSLTRLVDRRMQAAGVSRYADYVDLLQVAPRELQALLDALLINVTAMFRDPATWDLLREQLLPEALRQLPPDEPIRIWSAACATGEEAYSLAILLHELVGDEVFKARVKIYATDIDEAALAVARTGRLSAQAVKPLTEQQLETYFEPDGDDFRFRQDLRPSVIFGRHDLLRDAPISRVLLITCRNVLMYFTSETQTRVLERFPFALHEHGLLVLGKAEMLLSQSQLFTPVSLPHRVFRARHGRHTGGFASLAMGGLSRNSQVHRVTDAAFVSAPDAQLVVNSHGVLTLFNHRAETDLGLARSDIGRPFVELPVARNPVDLRGSVASVQAAGEGVQLEGVESGGSGPSHWDISITPLQEGVEVLGVHLTFHDVSREQELVALADQLRQELRMADEELQSTGEELETTNEELQSAVEELETTNEELQSTNEELETMNEELQSTNEELQSLNDELRDRTLQSDASNGFLQGILEGLDAAVIVIDKSYRVQLWNSGAETLSGLRAFEVEGLPLLDIPLGLPVDELHAALRSVITGEQKRAAVEGTVTDRFGIDRRRALVANELEPGESAGRGALITLTDN
ncbi:MAG: cheR [Frankiales bacterium]|nr:cheR [Frankiales bacterium]